VVAVVDTDRAAPPPAAPSPSFSRPPLSEARLKQLASEAGAALGLNNTSNTERRKTGKPAIVSSSSDPVRNGGISGASSGSNKTGEYVDEVVCLGEGTIRTTVWGEAIDRSKPRFVPTPTPDATVIDVRCGDKPTPVKIEVCAPKPERVFVQTEPDQAAIGHAAVARLIRMP
jgi:hypothetical protein